jgi:hypothetical protein
LTSGRPLHAQSAGMSSPRPELRLDWCSHQAARYACERWHYAHIIPRNKLAKIGVWEDGAFRGCVVFGPGASDALGSRYGLTAFQCCELVRIALVEHGTPVSRVMRVALTMVRQQYPGIRLIVSFADPAFGHHGGIYQGSNWIYAGMTASSDELIVHGRQMHGRAVRKTLEKYDIPGRNTAERAALFYRDPHVRVVAGSRKHRYLLPLDAEMRDRIAPLAQPYPKRVKQATDGHHPASDGAAPIHTLQEPAAA